MGQEGETIVTRVQTLKILPVELPGLDDAKSIVRCQFDVTIEGMCCAVETVLNAVVVRQLAHDSWCR